MIITKTPIRISLLGGGSDYPEHFLNHGGKTIGIGINKYSYISIKDRSLAHNNKILLQYSKTETTDKVEEIQHPSFRECLRYMNCSNNIEIHYTGDLPARTGLGSSSSFTVGLLNALHCFKKISISQEQLAKLAVFIEREMIKENVGYQDQYTAAISGIVNLNYGVDNKVNVVRLNLSKARSNELENHLMLFYTGKRRFASDILVEQMQKTRSGEITNELTQISDFVDKGIKILKGNGPISDFGYLLHKSWKLKRNLSSSISNNSIDEAYRKALEKGAFGGKLLGAGGGGFLLIMAPQKYQKDIEIELNGMVRIDFKIDFDGSRLIYED